MLKAFKKNKGRKKHEQRARDYQKQLGNLKENYTHHLEINH